MPKWLPVLFLVFGALLSACGASSADASDKDDPAGVTPEDVVYSFLSAQADGSDEASLYLTETLRESLPEGGVEVLLNLGGSMQGLVFQAGSGSGDDSTAAVEAHIKVNQQEAVRVFTLVRRDGAWQISGITSK
jgi:hypothetical protein